ncbi:gliding motility-associated-like protein [Mucilaginibacter frigoritolerans]|uniref:Gliding motility-associated-like protein n=1 Tax=Mucilaginibacter frigoritolerans TaxID=652788 RepID=A0A562TUT8_9SPHI|nr:PKD-like domain-containing protein [Mucilaginibacter frigoritolerans]TWI97273.1 gliding motility-associated-like protein [Mucilaginibacter frigoritolerans]
MRIRLLICLLLFIFAYNGYGQCTLNVVLSQPSVGICAGNVATLSANGGDTYTWYNAASGGSVVGTGQTFTTPVLNNTTTYYVVVSLSGCTSVPLPVTAIVTPFPQAPTANAVSICYGSTANLHASGSSDIFNWYTTPTGGTSLISSPDYTTPPLTASATYYVENTSNGCESPRTAVSVTVNAIPAAPATQDVTICYGTNASLTASGSTGTYQWFDALSGGNFLASGPTFNTPVLKNSTTYYVQATNGECTSTRTPVNVNVTPQLSPPAVSGAIICSGSVTTLTAVSQGGTYQWYSTASGGNPLATTATFTTPPLTATTTYYVENTFAGCTSPRVAVTVTVLAPTPAPTASGTSVCSGGPATLTATGTGSSYAWYDAATGGNLLSSSQVFVTPALTATVTYYVETTANDCTSPRTAVSVTVNSIPAAPTANGTSTCPGTSANLTASGTGTIQWYDAATGGTLLATGGSYNTPALSKTTTYYVQSTNGQCISSRTAVTVTVPSVSQPQFQYPSGTFCIAGANPSPVINNPAGGTFSATPAGLVFVSNTTGQIDITASTPGKYTIKFTGNDVCSTVSTAPVAIAAAALSQFSYNGPYCQDDVNPLPNYVTGASGGNFSATPAGLVFVSTSTGQIDLAASSQGNYTVTNTIAATGGCPSSTATANVIIYQRVNVSAGAAQTVLTGSVVQLAGSITGGTTSGQWTGGTGSFSNPTSPTSTYTPGPGETSATLTLTSADPTGPCGPKSSQVIITFDNSLNAPTATGTNVCPGSSATLTASATTGTLQWFNAATGGTLLATGSIYTTPPLNITATYYVQAVSNGIASNRTAVTVTVNTIPTAPVVTNSIACSGSTTTLTAGGSTGVYEWYDAPTGGNLIFTGSSYVTPVLTVNTTYYVQANNNGCISPRTQVNVSVTPVPDITSGATQNICSGNALNYTITASMPNATFLWSRAAIAGISNAAVTSQTSGTITETLINTTGHLINVTYVITAFNGSCPGPSLNYVVTVYPIPVVTSPPTYTICDYSVVNYTVTFNTPGTTFAWSRAAVNGISNAAVSGQTSPTIREALYNTTNAPIDVTYVITSQTSTCTGVTFNLVVTVNPNAAISSDVSQNACSGSVFSYTIQSNIPSATFTWSRDATAGISNAPVSNQTSGTISETLINTTNAPIRVVYNVIPTAFGCEGTPFQYGVIVNPPPATPVATSNSPVCIDGSINLSTDAVQDATYQWTGPNGFNSTAQSPSFDNITQANAGVYSVVVSVNGCPSQPGTVNVVIDLPPIANAGPDQLVCATTPSVQLAGVITGGNTTGIWSTAGTGTFSPSNTALNAQYIPSPADTTAGSVTLTLTSTGNCNTSASSMTIKFGPSPATIAGPNQTVCSQTNTVQLAGQLLIGGGAQWSSSGTGFFSPSDTKPDAIYIPSAQDIKNGSVELTLRATGASSCFIATNSLKVDFSPPPTVNAGGTRYVLKGYTITLDPVVSESDVTYLWIPDVDISNTSIKNPVITGDIDRTYTLTVTDSKGCVTSDVVSIIVSPKLVVPNTFTPNADGINDYWDIVGLEAYEHATVDIFTRWGQKVYHSIGYDKPWDGTFNNGRLPVGVYYYVIDTKVNGQILSGYITLIR